MRLDGILGRSTACVPAAGGQVARPNRILTIACCAPLRLRVVITTRQAARLKLCQSMIDRMHLESSEAVNWKGARPRVRFCRVLRQQHVSLKPNESMQSCATSLVAILCQRLLQFLHQAVCSSALTTRPSRRRWLPWINRGVDD